jgi:hypothetical protein
MNYQNETNEVKTKNPTGPMIQISITNVHNKKCDIHIEGIFNERKINSNLGEVDSELFRFVIEKACQIYRDLENDENWQSYAD